MFTTLENSGDYNDDADVNRAWRSIRGNIKLQLIN
jgi:hypothetical protein